MMIADGDRPNSLRVSDMWSSVKERGGNVATSLNLAKGTFISSRKWVLRSLSVASEEN